MKETNTSLYLAPNRTTHSALVVGYGKQHGQGYWLVKNSWSTSWGEDGYIKVAMKDHICGITEYPVAVVVRNPSFHLTMKSKLTQSDIDKLLSKINKTISESKTKIKETYENVSSQDATKNHLFEYSQDYLHHVSNSENTSYDNEAKLATTIDTGKISSLLTPKRIPKKEKHDSNSKNKNSGESTNHRLDTEQEEMKTHSLKNIKGKLKTNHHDFEDVKYTLDFNHKSKKQNSEENMHGKNSILQPKNHYYTENFKPSSYQPKNKTASRVPINYSDFTERVMENHDENTTTLGNTTSSVINIFDNSSEEGNLLNKSSPNQTINANETSHSKAKKSRPYSKNLENGFIISDENEIKSVNYHESTDSTNIAEFPHIEGDNNDRAEPSPSKHEISNENKVELSAKLTSAKENYLTNNLTGDENDKNIPLLHAKGSKNKQKGIPFFGLHIKDEGETENNGDLMTPTSKPETKSPELEGNKTSENKTYAKNHTDLFSGTKRIIALDKTFGQSKQEHKVVDSNLGSDKVNSNGKYYEDIENNFDKEVPGNNLPGSTSNELLENVNNLKNIKPNVNTSNENNEDKFEDLSQHLSEMKGSQFKQSSFPLSSTEVSSPTFFLEKDEQEQSPYEKLKMIKYKLSLNRGNTSHNDYETEYDAISPSDMANQGDQSYIKELKIFKGNDNNIKAKSIKKRNKKEGQSNLNKTVNKKSKNASQQKRKSNNIPKNEITGSSLRNTEKAARWNNDTQGDSVAKSLKKSITQGRHRNKNSKSGNTKGLHEYLSQKLPLLHVAQNLVDHVAHKETKKKKAEKQKSELLEKEHEIHEMIETLRAESEFREIKKQGKHNINEMAALDPEKIGNFLSDEPKGNEDLKDKKRPEQPTILQSKKYLILRHSSKKDGRKLGIKRDLNGDDSDLPPVSEISRKNYLLNSMPDHYSTEIQNNRNINKIHQDLGSSKKQFHLNKALEQSMEVLYEKADKAGHKKDIRDNKMKKESNRLH